MSCIPEIEYGTHALLLELFQLKRVIRQKNRKASAETKVRDTEGTKASVLTIKLGGEFLGLEPRSCPALQNCTPNLDQLQIEG